MAKTTTTGTAPKRRTKKQPKASTLYGYLNGYLNEHGIGEDVSIAVVMQNLRDTIVLESQEA